MVSNSTPRTKSTRSPVKKREFKLLDILQSDDLYRPCSCCNMRTPQVFTEGWACLNAACSLFWTTSDGSLLQGELRYDSRFLQRRSPYTLPANLQDIRPSQPRPHFDSNHTTYAFTRGWHCRDCGRLSCRFKWEHWECLNCKRTFGCPGRIIKAKELSFHYPYSGNHVNDESGITMEIMTIPRGGQPDGLVRVYYLPDRMSRICHFRPSTRVEKEADSIFEEYQEQASQGKLLFRRWPMRTHKCRGQLLSNYFSQNSGEPYHYVASTDHTIPFSQASGAVLKARKLIQDRILQALGKLVDFNEVLSCAYMVKQSMGFHSDDEPGLGPLVASLSLGAPAFMHFRTNRKHETGNPGHPRVALTVVLRHGDILVMDGANIQEYYQHMVTPTDFRIAATARQINKNNAKS